MAKGELNPADAELLATIADDAARGVPCRSNDGYGDSLDRRREWVADALGRLRARNLIVTETEPSRRRILVGSLGKWTGWSRAGMRKAMRESKNRKCLCCGQTFLSAHIGNRLCCHCNDRAAASSGIFQLTTSIEALR